MEENGTKEGQTSQKIRKAVNKTESQEGDLCTVLRHTGNVWITYSF